MLHRIRNWQFGWPTARGFPRLKSRELQEKRKPKSKGYVMESPTEAVEGNPGQDTPETAPPSEPDLGPEHDEPTTEDLELVAYLCRSNATPGALRVANALDKEVESRENGDADPATDTPNGE